MALNFVQYLYRSAFEYLTPVERWMGVEDLQTAHQQDRQKDDIDRVSRVDQRRVPIDQSAVGPIASPRSIASSHRRLHAFSADHDRGGFRAVLLHHDEDLAPRGELIGRRLVKGDDHRARRDGDRLFAA